MVTFGPLTAEINRFRVLSSLLQRRRSPEANQTVHDVWPLGILPRQNFVWCKIHFMFKSCVLLYWQHYCTARQQRASAKLCSMVQGMELWNCHRRCHLNSAEQPPRWALAHILVIIALPLQLYFIRATCMTTSTAMLYMYQGFWGILLINHFFLTPNHSVTETRCLLYNTLQNAYHTIKDRQEASLVYMHGVMSAS